MKNSHFIAVRRIASIVTILLLVFVLTPPYRTAQADGLTGISDTLNTLTQNVGANHEIDFTTPSGVAADDSTIIITFAAGFTMGSVAEDDIDVEDDNVDLTTAADCTGSDEASVDVTGQVVTITICSGDGGAIAAASEITVEIGTIATASGTGANQITNPNDENSHTTAITGTFGDVGQFAIDFVADDSVNVTSTVDPSITFSISDTTIGFGTLSASAARWATADTAGSATDTSAHTLSVGTNATDGYIVTYNGATLTSGGDTITVAAITDDENGTQGNEEFGMGFSSDGDTTIAAAYDHNATPANRDWAFVASTTTTLASEIVPTATETISAFYLANISADTEAGTYTTDITYIATATF